MIIHNTSSSLLQDQQGLRGRIQKFIISLSNKSSPNQENIDILKTRLKIINAQLTPSRIDNLSIIFKHYCSNVFKAGKHINFERIQFQNTHMVIERMFAFLKDFKLNEIQVNNKKKDLIHKNEIILLFKKISSNAHNLDFSEFIQFFQALSLLHYDKKNNFNQHQSPKLKSKIKGVNKNSAILEQYFEKQNEEEQETDHKSQTKIQVYHINDNNNRNNNIEKIESNNTNSNNNNSSSKNKKKNKINDPNIKNKNESNNSQRSNNSNSSQRDNNSMVQINSRNNSNHSNGLSNQIDANSCFSNKINSNDNNSINNKSDHKSFKFQHEEKQQLRQSQFNNQLMLNDNMITPKQQLDQFVSQHNYSYQPQQFELLRLSKGQKIELFYQLLGIDSQSYIRKKIRQFRYSARGQYQQYKKKIINPGKDQTQGMKLGIKQDPQFVIKLERGSIRKQEVDYNRIKQLQIQLKAHQKKNRQKSYLDNYMTKEQMELRRRRKQALIQEKKEQDQTADTIKKKIQQKRKQSEPKYYNLHMFVNQSVENISFGKINPKKYFSRAEDDRQFMREYQLPQRYESKQQLPNRSSKVLDKLRRRNKQLKNIKQHSQYELQQMGTNVMKENSFNKQYYLSKFKTKK